VSREGTAAALSSGALAFLANRLLLSPFSLPSLSSSNIYNSNNNNNTKRSSGLNKNSFSSSSSSSSSSFNNNNNNDSFSLNLSAFCIFNDIAYDLFSGMKIRF
jgi:hypothetical protein